MVKVTFHLRTLNYRCRGLHIVPGALFMPSMCLACRTVQMQFLASAWGLTFTKAKAFPATFHYKTFIRRYQGWCLGAFVCQAGACLLLEKILVVMQFRMGAGSSKACLVPASLRALKMESHNLNEEPTDQPYLLMFFKGSSWSQPLYHQDMLATRTECSYFLE